jgi:hypothetical protein
METSSNKSCDRLDDGFDEVDSDESSDCSDGDSDKVDGDSDEPTLQPVDDADRMMMNNNEASTCGVSDSNDDNDNSDLPECLDSSSNLLGDP